MFAVRTGSKYTAVLASKCEENAPRSEGLNDPRYTHQSFELSAKDIQSLAKLHFCVLYFFSHDGMSLRCLVVSQHFTRSLHACHHATQDEAQEHVRDIAIPYLGISSGIVYPILG
jgi:hypothetical protein